MLRPPCLLVLLYALLSKATLSSFCFDDEDDDGDDVKDDDEGEIVNNAAVGVSSLGGLLR